MVYVTLGLLLIFASVAFVGLQSIQQGTALVYQERLTRAYTIASTLTSDFRHVDGDVREERTGLSSLDPVQRAQVTNQLLDHLAQVDPFRFFHVTGLCLLSSDGRLLATAGSPTPQPGTGGTLAADTANLADASFQVLPTVDPADPNAFGAI